MASTISWKGFFVGSDPYCGAGQSCVTFDMRDGGRKRPEVYQNTHLWRIGRRPNELLNLSHLIYFSHPSSFYVQRSRHSAFSSTSLCTGRFKRLCWGLWRLCINPSLRGAERAEFVINGDSDTYIQLDIKLSVGGNMVNSSATDMDVTDLIAVNNNILNCLLNQSTVTLNGVPVTQSN